MDFVVAVLAAWSAVALLEFGDRTFILSAAMGSDYRWRKSAIAVGAGGAFAVTMAAAVIVGRGANWLFDDWLKYGVMTLVFAYFAWSFLSDLRSEDEDEGEKTPERSWLKQVWQAAALLGLAELGDKSQFAAGGVAVESGAYIAAFVGSWLGIMTVAMLGLVLGRWLSRYIPQRQLLLIAMVVFAVFALYSAVRFLFAVS